jgi:hypothetical protein
VSINERLAEFFRDISTDPVEERVAEYVVREVHNGRRLMDVMDDTYVRNRLTEEQREAVLEKPEVLAALEEEIRGSFRAPEVGFSD